MCCDDALINGSSYCKAQKNNKILMTFTSDPSGFFVKLVDKITQKAFRCDRAFRFLRSPVLEYGTTLQETKLIILEKQHIDPSTPLTI